MTLCYLALGSNLNGPERQIRRALKRLNALPQTYILAVAPLYKSLAWGRKVQPSFCNTVVAIKTCLSPSVLLSACRGIEKIHGRTRNLLWGARTLDIDILFYGQRVIDTKALKIPHPRVLIRDFVFIPLLDLAPNLRMPNGEPLANLILKHEYCKTLKLCKDPIK